MRHLMSRLARVLAGATLVALVTAPLAAQTPAPAPAPLTAADAKPLLGDWTINADSAMGPMAFVLTIKTEGDKAVGVMASDMIGSSPITDITKAGDNITLRYAFDYQGNAVPAEVTLTPAGDTLKVYFDFASGAFTMPGTATRKKA